MHLVYSAYNAPDSVLNLPFDLGLEMILKAREKETERTAWELWLTFDGQAKKENPWGEYLKNFKKPPEQKDTRTEEEILQDAENIMKRRF